MALGEIPPWLNVAPRDFVAAMESGARAGEAAASLDQRKQQDVAENTLKARQLSQQAQAEQAQQGFEQQKLDTGLQESAADRALKDKLGQQEMALNAAKFGVGTGLDVANLNLRQTNEARQEKALKDREDAAVQKLKLNAEKAVELSKFGEAVKNAKTGDDFNKILSDFGPLMTTPGALATWKGAYEKKVPTPAKQPADTTVTTQDVINGRPSGIQQRKTTIHGKISDLEDHSSAKGTEGIQKPTTQDQYDRLPKGAIYINPEGKRKIKQSDAATPSSQSAADAVVGYPE